ncbi:unnamed protein product [Boreogadus saida]
MSRKKLAWANKEVETFVCILGEEDVVYDVYVAAAAIDIRPTTKGQPSRGAHGNLGTKTEEDFDVEEEDEEDEDDEEEEANEELDEDVSLEGPAPSRPSRGAGGSPPLLESDNDF